MNFMNYGHKNTVKVTLKESAAVVEMAESTQPVLEEEKIQLGEDTTVQEVVAQVKKSKKLHAKVEEGGKKVRVKRVLQD